MRPFNVIEGGSSAKILKAGEVQEIKYTVEEEKVFPREEIVALIVGIANSEGFKIADLEITDEFYTSGDLVQLIIKVKESRSQVEGWGKIEYIYVIKGKFVGTDEGSVDSTGISRVYATISKPNKYVRSGTVAEFKNGKWELSPGEAEDI